ncbi:MAG: mannose-1-phosphate guanylyltransferase [Bacteroidetes bacterium]|nr:mannose-1-phosphate guanylyltransferase [Bacteroidota bacterium]
MKVENLHLVIMAGGIGSRFWPYSRNSLPKQFLDVLDTGKTLLQLTYDRFKNLASEENIYIVSNQQYKQIILDQLPGISADQILSEPVRRNTAPCVAYASYKIRKKDPNAVIVVSPADHAIFGEIEYLNCIRDAVKYASSEDILITLGIKPTKPETGYGYIQYIKQKDKGLKKVKTFTEKPQIDLAKTFIDSGDFVWNAGIFIWSVKSITSAFEQYLPEVAELFDDCTDSYSTDNEQTAIDRAYSQIKNISIDYGIMEKATNVHVILGEFGWSDIGSWSSLYEIKDKDDSDNVVGGNALLFNCSKNIIHGKSDKVIVMQDLEGYLVADFDDVLLICKKDEEAKFREFVSEVKSKKGDKYL